MGYRRQVRARLCLSCVVAAFGCVAAGGSESEETSSESSDELGSEGPVDSEDSVGFSPIDSDSGESGDGLVDSHDEDIHPLWLANCIIYCHGNNPRGPAGELSLEYEVAWDNLVDAPAVQADMVRVSPGSLEDSYLWHKLQNTHFEVGGSGERMPPGPVGLDEDSLAKIEAWILAGAPR